MSRNGLSLALAFVMALFIGAAASAQTVLVDIPMDQQINLHLPGTDQSPNGDAIYIPDFGNGTLSFETDGVEGWARHSIASRGWWYLYLDLNLAGIGSVDLSDPTKLYKIDFDCRYYQDPVTNSNPYADAPVFLRIYTYADDGVTHLGNRDFGIVYATQAPWNNPPYPDWTHVSVVLNNSELQSYTDSGTFNLGKVNRLRWQGTDWNWVAPGDFVDVKNFQIIEEIPPATVSGTVTNGAGAPIEGAVVGIKASPQAAADALRYAVTGADGKYSFMMESGDYYVAAWAPGYVPSPDASVALAGADITGVDLQVTTLVADNIAPGSTVSATNEDTGAFPAVGGVDDNLGTRWTTLNPLPENQQDQSYTIDLGAVKSVTGITIVWENAYPGAYEVLLTTDDPNGSPTWTTVYSAPEANGGWQAPSSALHYEPIVLPAQTQARGIRIHVTKFGPYPVYSAWEFYVHGDTRTQIPVQQMTIQAAKQMPDGAKVQLIKPVSASGMWDGGESTVFRNKFWMEEPDRSAGIRIDMVDHWCYPSEVDYVKGTMATDPVTGERYILGETVNWIFGPNVETRPFAMANKGLTEGDGLPVGLLVRTWGKVVEVMDDGYTISDGSGGPVKVVTDGLLPSVGAFVAVTGPLGGEPTIYVRPGDGFLRSWLFHGGYSTPDPNPAQSLDSKWVGWQQNNLNEDFLTAVGGEAAVQPNPGDTGPNGGTWYAYSTSNWYFDLSTMSWTPSGYGMTAIYASLWLYADREYVSNDPITGEPNDGLVIQVGTDDGYKLYLNGEPVYENNVWRGIPGPDALDQISYNELSVEPIVLNQGWNHLLIKVNNITGGWAMGARLVIDDPGNPTQKAPLNLPVSLGTP